MRRAFLRGCQLALLLAPIGAQATPALSQMAVPSPRERRALVRAYGVRVMPGRLVLGRPDDAFIANAGRPPRVRGLFDVVIHGNQHSTGIQRADGSWIDYDAAGLAAEIRASGAWNGKRPVRLLSCHVAAGSIDLAQRLADLLRVSVYAPADYISLTPGAADFGLGHAPTKPLGLEDLQHLSPQPGA